VSDNWEGVPAATAEHRTVGSYRAWCHEDKGWCYAPKVAAVGYDGLCECCAEAVGYRIVRVPPDAPTVTVERWRRLVSLEMMAERAARKGYDLHDYELNELLASDAGDSGTYALVRLEEQ